MSKNATLAPGAIPLFSVTAKGTASSPSADAAGEPMMDPTTCVPCPPIPSDASKSAL
eukprot:CAMPEP_0180154528 /NCGR_PEP_ID=MMETSP0986-20121125/24229_1 /TAXON_ID=697907 /ORGANISM="non described non described, Strain CCMP2293" /LENGTH=56 /DNA_ID=CAMNT_0022102933 /DNA_START=231 /DNA_END=401 /DNA_ORIENTATION=+